MQAREQALDKRAYDQNYECAFADENLTLLSHELICGGGRVEKRWDSFASRIGSPAAFATDEGGVTGDSTWGSTWGGRWICRVVTVMEDWRRVEGGAGDFADAESCGCRSSRSGWARFAGCAKFRRAAIDMTGLGLGLVEYLQEEFGASRIYGVNFSTTVPATRAVALEGRKRETVRVTEALAMDLLQVYEDRTNRSIRRTGGCGMICGSRRR